jgi:hypothetical protein
VLLYSAFDSLASIFVYSNSVWTLSFNLVFNGKIIINYYHEIPYSVSSFLSYF